MNCNAVDHETGARCALRSGHEGCHEDSQAHGWKTRREREGKVAERNTSLDLACVERVDLEGEVRWRIVPTPERVENGATEGLPMVMYAFHERNSAEAVCVTLNAMAIGDAMGAVVDAEAVAA